METIIFGFVTAFLITFISIPSLIRVAHMKQLVDEPGDKRKLHNKRIPTIGGILIFAGTLFSYFLWYPFEKIHDYEHLNIAIKGFKYIGACMLILFFIGVKDDIIGTAPVKKLIGHLVVAFILVFMAEIKITSMHGLFGITEIEPWASICLSVLTYTVIVNAFNLIDGVDGLAAGIGMIACISFGIWFYLAGGIENASLAFALAGALLGFLWYNSSPARIFMGDSGSLTIGMIVAVLAIKLIEFKPIEQDVSLSGISRPIFAMAILSYPLLDTFRIFIYRAVKGTSPFAADRKHIHHRLIDIGLSHRMTVWVLYFFSLFIIAIAIFVRLEVNFELIAVGGTAVVLAQLPFFIPKKRKPPKT